MMLLSLLNRLTKLAGLQVSKLTRNEGQYERLVQFLDLHGVRDVIDIGANRGQFARSLFEAGYSGQITSFEAHPDVRDQLAENARRSGLNWRVMPAMAIADKCCEADLFVTNASECSSLLKPAATDDLAPASIFLIKEKIKIKQSKLDDLLDELIISGPFFLKIDTQGNEAEVLFGAQNAVHLSVGIMIEMSYQEIYEGQKNAYWLDDYLRKFGFEIWDHCDAYRDRSTRRLIQFDAVYFKKI